MPPPAFRHAWLAQPPGPAYETAMNRLLSPTVALALVLLLPLAPAVAQKQGPLTDQEYCDALVATYTRYLGQSSARSQYPDASASNAIADCQKGNTAAGIPALEQRLKNAGFSLPSRQRP